MFRMFRIWGTIAVVVAVLSVFGFAYKTYNNMKTQIETLTADNAVLDGVVTSQNEAIRMLNENNDRQRVLISNLQEGFDQAERETEELRTIFNDHDLGDLAQQRPQLIEDRINAGTRNAFRELESLTTR